MYKLLQGQSKNKIMTEAMPMVKFSFSEVLAVFYFCPSKKKNNLSDKK